MKISKEEFLAGSKRRSKSKPVFETERLLVSRVRGIRPNHFNLKRDVYMAFRTDEERPLLAVNAVLLDRQDDCFVDWLEVASEYRRQGFATEFLEGLEEFLGRELFLTPGSTDGEAFLAEYRPDE